MFFNFLNELLNTILEKLQDKLANNFMQAWVSATRKIWRKIKTSRLWKIKLAGGSWFPRKALGPLGTLLLLTMDLVTGHHAGVADTLPAVDTQATTYQVSGAECIKLDSAKWMKDGIVDYGSMVRQLIPANSTGDPKDIVYRVPRGRNLKLRLPDGSLVHLNAGTRVRISQNFGKDNREVIVEEGEVFLDVVPNENKVFTARTKKADVTVLGTSFNISNYSSNNYCQISVITGKVLVTSKNGSKENKVTVSANKAAVIDKISGKIAPETIKADEVLAWREGRYISNGKTAKEVCEALERLYNIRIAIDDPSICEEIAYFVVFSKNPVTDFFKQLQLNDKSIQYYQDSKGTWHLSKIIN